MENPGAFNMFPTGQFAMDNILKDSKFGTMLILWIGIMLRHFFFMATKGVHKS
jgi:hypothetical protein